MSQSYEAIINMAIGNEVEAYEFYFALSQKDLSPELKSMFAELAAEEKKHETALKAFMQNPDKPLQFKSGADYKVSEGVAMPALSLDMKPVDAIALAMKKEEEAMKSYTAFAQASSDSAQAATFEQLAKMEQGHKARLEDIYTNMAFPEAW